MGRNRVINWSIFIFLLLIIGGTLLVLSSQNRKKQKGSSVALCRNCNLVILDIDVLRSDAIDCQNRRSDTPNICKLEDSSVDFLNHSNQSSLTITSFVTTTTSLYPSSHGIWNEIYNTDIPGVRYLSEILKDSGYNTMLAGHVLNYWQVTSKGYDSVVDAKHMFAKEFTPVDWVKNLQSNGKPFFLHIYMDDMHFPYLLQIDRAIPNPYERPKGLPLTMPEFTKMQADYVTKHYKDIFTDQAIADNRDLFYGNLQTKEDKILDLFLEYSSKAGKAYLVKDAWAPTRDTYFQNFDQNNPNDINYIKSNYLGILHLFDQQIGDFLDFLSQKDLGRDTVLVFKSSHGEEFLDHGELQHGNDLFQELTHTPLLIKVPGVKPSKVRSLTEDVDVMPTILNLLGVSIPSQAQGKSLVPAMLDPKVTIREYQIAQKGDQNYEASFRKGYWKIIAKQGVVTRLYNLSEDPGEKDNLINKPALPYELFVEYKTVVDELPKYGSSGSPLPTFIDQEKRQRLKDEGYF